MSAAIAIFRYSDYAAAAVPVLPVKCGKTAAKRHMTAYMLAFVAATLMLTAAGYTGYAYLTVAAAAGAAWLTMAWAGYRTGFFGKWSLGVMGTTGQPDKKGFDEYLGYLNQGHAHFYYPE